MKKNLIRMVVFWISIVGLCGLLANAGVVEFSDRQLIVDGTPQPQLFGAELQYFRMRGGLGRNVPRSKVLMLWDKALDRMLEAHMNSISFYIPWDFHEYKEGYFDFDGTADEDGDGNPDFPSRDVKTFLEMVVKKGFKSITVRPGPYINAEWGFLGFGAIPPWFHEKYRESHMQNPQGQKTQLFDLFDPQFQHHTVNWFQHVYNEVLKNYIGPDRPIQFFQIDNETNYMWQTIYNHDYSPRSQARYREFLKEQYTSLDLLNDTHRRSWKNWDEIKAPTTAGANLKEDQDWYRFEDQSLFKYLQFIRTAWEKIGVKEPNVAFTLAEAYGAPAAGIMPNFLYRNHSTTGMMTINLYPKTWDNAEKPLFNFPFKADHDIKAVDAANDSYFGRKVEWVMGPEIQGGWFRGAKVSTQARQQLYLSSIGHGLKSLGIYYFVEGQNWEDLWLLNRIKGLYNELKLSEKYRGLQQPSDEFWSELQRIFDDNVVSGYKVREIFEKGPQMDPELHFDTPIDKEANPTEHFQSLAKIGKNIVGDYGQWLGSAKALEDPVCVLETTESNVPSPYPVIDSVQMNTEWTAGLIGYLEHRGINSKIFQWGITPTSELKNCKVIFYQDSGIKVKGLAEVLKRLANEGATVVSTLCSDLSHAVGFDFTTKGINTGFGMHPVLYQGKEIQVNGPQFAIEKMPDGCKPILFDSGKIVGARCSLGKGQWFQLGVVVYVLYNTPAYSLLQDHSARRTLLDEIVGEVPTHLRIIENDQAVAAFARTNTDHRLWITTKNGRSEPALVHILIADVGESSLYQVKDLMSEKEWIVKGSTLKTSGLAVSLDGYGSTVLLVSPLN